MRSPATSPTHSRCGVSIAQEFNLIEGIFKPIIEVYVGCSVHDTKGTSPFQTPVGGLKAKSILQVPQTLLASDILPPPCLSPPLAIDCHVVTFIPHFLLPCVPYTTS